MVFNIQRFSTRDGKGIRTVVFFKGCPLSCLWCSNPEGQSMYPEIFFDLRKCILCLTCTEKSENGEFKLVDGKIVFDRSKVKDPLLFKDICPSKAIEVVGETFTVDEVVDEILKDQVFYQRGGGGVTFSGGEPFSHPVFLKSLCQKVKEHDIDISVETCLNVPWENIENSTQYIDQFLADLKHTDPDKFKDYTGGNVDLILSNLRELEKRNVNVVIRIPVLPGFNDSMAEMKYILDFAAGLTNVKEVNFLLYHKLGVGKYSLLGKKYNFTSDPVEDELIQEFVSSARERGLNANIGG